MKRTRTKTLNLNVRNNSQKLKRVNQDRKIFSKNVELTPTLQGLDYFTKFGTASTLNKKILKINVAHI